VTCALPFCYKYSRLGSPLTIPAAAQRSKRKHAAVSDFPLLIPSSLSAMAMRAQVSGLLLLLLLLPLAPAPSRAATPARSSSSTAVFQLHGDVYPTGYPSSLPSILADQGRLVSGIRRESRPRWVPVLAIEFDAKVVFFRKRGELLRLPVSARVRKRSSSLGCDRWSWSRSRTNSASSIYQFLIFVPFFFSRSHCCGLDQ
jgi:hypothetical protein